MMMMMMIMMATSMVSASGRMPHCPRNSMAATIASTPAFFLEACTSTAITARDAVAHSNPTGTSYEEKGER